MSQPIKAADLFSDETSAVGAAKRLDGYLDELNKSFSSPREENIQKSLRKYNR